MSGTNDNAPSSAPHWPVLDGLRGLAVAGVVAYHLGHLGGGFLGVDLFFVLSGFLITSLLVAEVEHRGRVDLLAFWGRRFRRLLPAVTAMIAAVLTLLARAGTAAERAAARDDAGWALGYLANWHQIAAAHDYWSASAASSVFKHLWSLAIEEQFYVLWPAVVWVLLRLGRRTGFVVTLGAAAASGAAMVLLASGGDPSRSYLGTDTRAVSLLLGAAVALPGVRGRSTRWVTAARAAHPVRMRILLDAAAIAIAAAWVVGGDHLTALLRGGIVLHASVAAALIAVTTAAPVAEAHRSVIERIGGAAPLVWLGRRSYGVYLWHWPFIVLASTRWTQLDGWAKDAGIIAATLLAAVVSYELLEQPIRRRTGWAADPRTARFAMATCAVLAVVAVAVAPDGRGDVAAFSAPVGSPASVSPTTAPAAAISSAASSMVDAGARSSPVGAGRPGATSSAEIESMAPVPPTTEAPSARAAALAPPRPAVSSVLWIGDSVAADEAPAIVAALGAAGVPAVDGAFAGRRLVESDGVVPAELFPPLLERAHADLVIVQLSLWDSPFAIEQLRAAFASFADLVAPTGAQLLFVTPPPVREDLIDPGLANQVQVARELVIADPAHVGILDTGVLWGPVAVADIDGDGAPDRKYDLVHVCPQGAARFAGWLVDRLAERYAGIVAAAPDSWMWDDWPTDERYDTPVGACAALPPSAG